jgi:DNA polymerase phi
MIDLIAGTSQDEKQLSDKAKGILRSRIAKSKDVPSGVDADQVLAVLSDLHVRARKVHSSELLATLSQSSIYLSKILIQADAEKSLIQVYSQSLADFIMRKNSALNTNFFQDFIRRCPTTAWQLWSDLLDLSSKSVNAYRQLQVFKLLETLIGQLQSMVCLHTFFVVAIVLTYHQGTTPPSEVSEFMTSLRKSLLDVATNACDEKVTLSAPQLKEVLKLGLVAVRQTQRISPKSIGEIWQTDSWIVLSKRLRSCHFKASPQLITMCEQIALIVGSADGSIPTEKTKKTAKRKAPDSNGVDKPAAAKRAKRKKVKTDES